MAEASGEVTVIAQGRFIRLVKRGHWEYVERNKVSGIVGLVAVTPDRKILLIEHFNTPFGKQSIELPAGLAGDVAGQEGETLDTAAFRELMEETGYAADKLSYLATGTSSLGPVHGADQPVPGGGDEEDRAGRGSGRGEHHRPRSAARSGPPMAHSAAENRVAS